MVKKINRLMAEIPHSDPASKYKSIVPCPKAFVLTELHENPFIGFCDMLLTDRMLTEKLTWELGRDIKTVKRC